MHDPVRQLVADALARSRAADGRSVSAGRHVVARLGVAQGRLGAEVLRLARLATAVHAGEAADGTAGSLPFDPVRPAPPELVR